MAQPAAFRTIGVVEGFYGRVWSDAERERFLAALAPFGLNAYLYAPKHEGALSEHLLKALDKAAAQRLRRLHRACEAHGVALWAGLHLAPPFDPGRRQHVTALVRKALRLTQLGVKGLAVLCDDLPSTRNGGPKDPFHGSLAEAQAHAFRILHEGLSKRGVEVDWALCPSRYTLDPALESIYGPFAPDYLARLHEALPVEVPWLWTGPQVCSMRVALDDVEAYRQAAGMAPGTRPLILWDNYPVNDAALSGKLHLAPLEGRGPRLPEDVSGYLFNPLLQPHLGVLPGSTCLAYANDPAGYDPTAAWQAALEAHLPPDLHKPVTELAALTRTSEGVAGAAVAAAGVTGNLPQRLVLAWDALARGDPVEPYLLIDFRRTMNALQQTLPAAMREEATPWLGRLWRALRLFEASADGAPQEVLAPLRAEFSERRGDAPLPEVLGAWFP